MAMSDGMKKITMDKIHRLEKEILDLRSKVEKKQSDLREAKAKLSKG